MSADPFPAGRDPIDVIRRRALPLPSSDTGYRSMFRGLAESWNLRDQHMTDTLVELLGFLGQTRPDARAVVWAHNSHLGDARDRDGRRRRWA